MLRQIKYILASILIFSSFNTYSGYNQTRIHIYGEIVGKTCSIKEENLEVDLGITTNKDLFFHKQARNFSNFDIEFECNDPNEEYEIDIMFKGVESPELDLQGTLKININSMEYPKLGIQLAEGHDIGKLFSLNNTEVGNYKIKNGTSIPFSAYLRLSNTVPTVDDIPIGYYDATANFIVEYE